MDLVAGDPAATFVSLCSIGSRATSSLSGTAWVDALQAVSPVVAGEPQGFGAEAVDCSGPGAETVREERLRLLPG